MKFKSERQKRFVWFTVGGVLVMVLLLGIGKAMRIYRTGMQVLDDVRLVQDSISLPPSVEDLGTVEPLLTTFQEDLNTFHDEMDTVLWVAPLVKWVPVYGCDMAAAPHALELAEALTDASTLGYQAGKPILDAFESEDVNLTPTLATQMLVQAHPHFMDALEAFETARTAREGIDAECLSPYTKEMLTTRIDPALELLGDALSMAVEFPSLVGAPGEGPKSYLLLLQNEDELRPTGGFITAGGTLTLQEGQVLDMSFENSGYMDNWNKPYPVAPWQLQQYMSSPVLVFRDANWFTDYPTSALFAEFLFSYSNPTPVDGVIALDQHVLVSIMRVAGPIEIESADYPIDAGNITFYMQAAKASTSTYVGTDKAFLNEISAALLDKLLNDEVDWKQLIELGLQLLDERHILMQIDNPRVTGFLSRRGWDGSIQLGNGDFLMVVDSNIGFNKTNLLVTTTLSYDIDLTDPQSPTSTLTVFHKNDADSKVPCIQRNGLTLRGQKDYPTDRCYWDYMRVYTPAGTTLQGSDVQGIPADWMIRRQSIPAKVDILKEDIAGVQAFGVLKVVPGGQSRETSFEFDLPDNIVSEQPNSDILVYHLRIKKQPGTMAIPITIRIHFANNTIIETVPPGAIMQENNVLLETDLREDKDLEISFRIP